MLTIYNCLWFDFSPFYWLFGETINVYRVGSANSAYYLPNKAFAFTFIQGQAFEYSTYTVRALNTVLG